MSPDSEWTDGKIRLPGRGETYVREASGPADAPTLLLLHGLAATGLLNWRPCLERLARDYRVVVMDHRGHGRGMRIRQPFRLADCADDAAALLDVLELDRVIAVGYSMGGPIAQLLWKRHPQRVAGLVFCATSCRFASTERRRLAFALAPVLNVAGHVAPRRFLRRMSRQWISERIGDEAMRERILSEVYASDPVAIGQAAAAVMRFDSSGWIDQVDVPTSVVLTELDRLVRPRGQRKMADRIPGAILYPVEGDHGACVTRPDRFVPALREACASVVGRMGKSAP